MGWFDEQIRQREELDDTRVKDAFADMAGAVSGKKYPDSSMTNSDKQREQAVREILRYYHIRRVSIPDDIKKPQEQINYFLHMTGVKSREVQLKGHWFEDSMGALLAKTVEGDIIALIPHGYRGYVYRCPRTGKRIMVSRSNAEQIATDAVCLYRPFEKETMKMGDFVHFVLSSLSLGDIVVAVIMTLLLAGTACIIPYASELLFDKIIPAGSSGVLFVLFAMLLGVVVSRICFQIIYHIVVEKVKMKVDVMVSAAAMMRTISMPMPFFHKYSSGDLAARVENMKIMGTLLMDILYGGVLSIVSLITCFVQLSFYGRELILPILMLTLVMIVFVVFIGHRYAALLHKRTKLCSEQSGYLFSVLSGIQKIKLTGTQKRFFAKWAVIYKDIAKKEYAPGFFVRLRTIIIPCLLLVGNVIIYYYASISGMRPANFFASFSIYGQIGVLFVTLAELVFQSNQMPALIDNTRVIMETAPEGAVKKHITTRLSGNIELSHVSFRYNENQPMILNDLSLKISRGEYVAIVGESGCGKSTLMRLLLGFIEPVKGAVYFDGRDLKYLDGSSFRRKIGVVLQGGMLFKGDIFSNITIAKPEASLDEAWEAAKMAGLDEDIRNMPMGMNTLVSEGNGGISGGQKQRILIARAILARPKILLLDEATSALDNITQKRVSEALAGLRCTRVVIAHRLSTIRQCDRIVYLDKGQIIEDGTYDELIKLNGYFTKLVERQQLPT